MLDKNKKESESIGPKVLGIVGSNFNLVPSREKKIYRIRLKTLIHNRVLIPEPDYALVTMDYEMGPWICKALMSKRTPYVVVVPTVWLRDLPQVCKYWLRKAAGIVYIPEENRPIPHRIDHRGRLLTPSQNLILARNNYVSGNCQQLIYCAPHPGSCLTKQTTADLPLSMTRMMETTQPAYGNTAYWTSSEFKRAIQGTQPIWVTNNSLVRVGFAATERVSIMEYQHKRSLKLSKNSKGKVHPRTGVMMESRLRSSYNQHNVAEDDDVPF